MYQKLLTLTFQVIVEDVVTWIFLENNVDHFRWDLPANQFTKPKYTKDNETNLKFENINNTIRKKLLNWAI